MTPQAPGFNFEDRFSSLEAASRSLSADVNALNLTLQVVADLQMEQREQARRQAKTETEFYAAKAAAGVRDRRTRSAITGLAAALGVLLPLVSILVYLSLVTHVNGLLKMQAIDRYTGCQLRNTVQLSNADREQALADAEPNPALKAVHQKSATLQRSLVAACVKPKP